MAGTPSEKLQQRVAQIGIQGYANEAGPVVFWDLYGKAGHPIRATVSEVGPSLLARMLEIAFKLADDRGLLRLDLDDLRALMTFVGDNRKEISTEYGLISTQRSRSPRSSARLGLEREGGDALFGEPALDLKDFMRTDTRGRGIVNILAADQLVLQRNPRGTKRRQGMVEAMAKQAARTVGSQIGRQIVRGVLGGILGGSRK
jgi:hypothetical protein